MLVRSVSMSHSRHLQQTACGARFPASDRDRKLTVRFTAIVLLILAGVGTARADVTKLRALWDSANELCRGSGDKDVRSVGCALRDVLGPRIDKLGWCHGKQGQFGAQDAWHRCGKTSLHLDRETHTIEEDW